ncbi:MAG: histone deacetylase family protein [Planctomycetales bacterium]|nr:histone deacetylase family protein [Planctomycetales bacterium]MCA9169797.1 histone deacetylase family protein [Planctomycetales bacterium]
MFRIRRIHDDVLPINQTALNEVRLIFREQFPDAPVSDLEPLSERLRNPFLKRFRTVLYVAENSRRRVLGFAIVLHEPELKFCYLDFLATDKKVPGRGIGAALYEHVRDEALGLAARGLFFECLPDDADACSDVGIRKLNAARLKFYEVYGALPIVGTAYESAVPGGSSECLPHLVYDGLDSDRPLEVKFARQVVRAILERKYSHLCPPEYVSRVVDSFRDNPVKLRNRRYSKLPVEHAMATPHHELIALAINDKHDIHHIRERGYVEAPVRIAAIRGELEASGLTETIEVKAYPLKHILAVHDQDFVEYLSRACASAPQGKSVYPYVFPIRNAARPPKELSVRAGYFCIDTFTPINNNAFPAAKRAVDCVLTAADAVLSGRRLAYALVRPPGHHAERRSFGGFCYFSNAAIGADYLSKHGNVAILDIDYHHGNGQQDIFYDRADVLTLSLHGDPDFAYPYFTGFADEQGSGEGLGYNHNFPLPEQLTSSDYTDVLRQAIKQIIAFDPAFLVIALGLDPAKGDPTGTWSLSAKDFRNNGRLLGELKLPTLIVQEGGYRTRTLGRNALAFFQGMVAGTHE